MTIKIQKLKSISFMIPAGIFVLSIFYISQCFKLNFGTLSLPEEGMVPFLFGSLLFVGSFLIMGQVLIGSEDISSAPKKVETYRVISFTGVLFGYVIILPILGFILSTFILVIGTMKLMGAKLKTSIITGLIVVVVSYLLFRVWLKVPLPLPIFVS